MRKPKAKQHTFRLASATLAALATLSSHASAGGFSVGEQSTVFLGSAPAGAAAGGTIGSMFWNPAATAALPGINTESSYTLILPYANAHADGPLLGTGSSGNVGIDAETGASYGTYQLSNDFWLGMALNSPFGLATKPDNTSYPGSVLGLTTKLITLDANPTFAYRIAPGITIGAGVQIMWAQGKLQFAENPAVPSVGQFLGTDWAFGGTAGIMLEPQRGTSIGLGYRSQMDLDRGGKFKQPLTLGPGLQAGSYGATATLNLPNVVTLSLRQEVSPRARLLGTVEWTNWSRFKSLDLVTAGIPGGGASIPANWSDDWFFSVGGEYDYSPVLTLRSGVGYELSPEDSAIKRFTTIPDNNRVWLNVGASYKWSDTISFDVAYSHIFVQDGGFDRTAPVSNLPVSGTIDAAADIVSVGMRSVW